LPWRPSASPAAGDASRGGVSLLTPALLLRRERGHQARAFRGFRSGRDAAATRRPADGTGCISKSAPVGDREPDDPGLRNRVEARAGDSRAEVENSVAHAAPALRESKRPDLSAPHCLLARAFAQTQACAACARHACSCSRARPACATATPRTRSSARPPGARLPRRRTNGPGRARRRPGAQSRSSDHQASATSNGGVCSRARSGSGPRR
jgi:hypothetical protein